MRLQESVRRLAAAQLHHLCVSTTAEQGRSGLVRPLLRLAADASLAVLAPLLPHLPAIVARFPLAASAATLWTALLDLEAEHGARHWRIVVAVVRTAGVLAAQLPQEVQQEELLPLLFRVLQSGPVAAEDAAAEALVTVFRGLRRERVRTDVRCPPSVRAPQVCGHPHLN